MISRVFKSKFQAFKFQCIHIASVSGHTLRFTFKICQIFADTIMISQFHEFFDLIFGGVLIFGPTVRASKERKRDKVPRRDKITGGRTVHRTLKN